ncbi:AAA family ATPase [Paenibacillus sp. 1P07SE]|uniref:AAA family ATPase n=1 Tax=Paenibacillus sp. 1P07SE TaxID=3132209 RepID=UPI0039A7065D
MGCEAKFYRGDAKRQLHREIELMRGLHHLKPCVIVDEAHLLDREMLEEVRFLLNVRMDSESPTRFISNGTMGTPGGHSLLPLCGLEVRQMMDKMFRLSPVKLRCQQHSTGCRNSAACS